MYPYGTHTVCRAVVVVWVSALLVHIFKIKADFAESVVIALLDRLLRVEDRIRIFESKAGLDGNLRQVMQAGAKCFQIVGTFEAGAIRAGGDLLPRLCLIQKSDL